ncbi:unnamed protein product [Caenorhabditis brenneri]
MTSINETAVTSTIPDIPIKVNADLITGCIFFVLFVLIILFSLYLCADAAYVKLKSYRKGPKTLIPVVPFPQDNLQVFKGTDRLRNVVPDAKIQISNGKTEKPAILLRFLRGMHGYLATLNEFMASTFMLHSRLPHEYEEVRSETNERHYRIKPKISVSYHARTISIKMIGYEHGEKCHDFVPIGGAAPESHFTYQMYGDNRIQVTRYVVDGKSEVAGFCIYTEHPYLSKLEYRWSLLNKMARSAQTSTLPETSGGKRNETIQRKIEVVPNETAKLISQESDDREWTVKYCPKRQRKMTSSNWSVDTPISPPRIIRVTPDLIFAFVVVGLFALIILILVLLCAYEVYTKLKSYRKGPITLTPVIPFPQNDMYVFKGTGRYMNVPDAKIQEYNGRNKRPIVSFLLDPSREKYHLFIEIDRFLKSIYRLHRLPDEYEEVRSETGGRLFRIKSKISVPDNVRTISIKMNGYEHGEKCHDFVPIGEAAPGSHFTYQMYGDNRIQVTRYVVDGKSEMAGFCIYIEHPWISKEEYRWSLLYEMARSAKITENSPLPVGRRENQAKIEEDPEENTNLTSHLMDDREWTGKYCSKLRRVVLSSVDSDGVVVHQEWIHWNNQMKIQQCHECTKEGLKKEEQPPTYSSIFIA